MKLHRVVTVVLFAASLWASHATATEIVVDVSAVGEAREAAAVNGKAETAGTIEKSVVTFANLAAKTAYDLRIGLADGRTLQGVNLNWYNDDEPASPDAGELTDDDRGQIAQIMGVPSFYDRSEIVLLRGNHDRAVALVQLVREKDFHAGGGNVIWRMELWYFKNQHGGWEKIAQQNKVLCRERFKNPDEFKAVTAKVKWLTSLGGILLTDANERKRIAVSTDTEADDESQKD